MRVGRDRVLWLSLALLVACSRDREHSTAATPSSPTSTAPAPASTDKSQGAYRDRPGSSTSSDMFESRFLGEDDGARRAALRSQPVSKVEKGKGGRSLAFKLTVADETVGYYKPEQTFSGSHWYAEVASYYLDRALGLGRVPPVVGRSLPWSLLAPAAGDDERVKEIVVQQDGTVRGAFIWWIPEKLERLPMGQGWEKWVRMEPELHVSPYQRPQEWKDDRNAGSATHPWPSPAGEPDTVGRPAELSDMILFDYLTTNVDRWGGENQNVRTRTAVGPLIYLDNGAGFTPGEARIPLTDARLETLQRFRRSTVSRIRQLDFEHLRSMMATDALAPILTEKQWQHLRERHKHLVEYVDESEHRWGERTYFSE